MVLKMYFQKTFENVFTFLYSIINYICETPFCAKVRVVDENN